MRLRWTLLEKTGSPPFFPSLHVYTARRGTRRIAHCDVKATLHTWEKRRRVWRVLGVDSACVACDVILLCLRPRTCTFAPRSPLSLLLSRSLYYSVLFYQTRSCARGASHAALHLSRRVPAHARSHEASGFQPSNARKPRMTVNFFFPPKTVALLDR